MTIGEFAELAVRLRALFRLSATSWGRCIEHNDQVGGVKHSAHLLDLAVDLVPVREGEVLRVMEMGLRLGLLVIPEGDHYHVQPHGWPKG